MLPAVSSETSTSQNCTLELDDFYHKGPGSWPDTNPQTDPPIKYHLYNTKHISVLSEIKKTDG